MSLRSSSATRIGSLAAADGGGCLFLSAADPGIRWALTAVANWFAGRTSTRADRDPPTVVFCDAVAGCMV